MLALALVYEYGLLGGERLEHAVKSRDHYKAHIAEELRPDELLCFWAIVEQQFRVERDGLVYAVADFITHDDRRTMTRLSKALHWHARKMVQS